MSEPVRLAYLDAMGVDAWFPRVALPGAKPSPLLTAPPAAVVTASTAGAPAINNTAERVAPEAAVAALKDLTAQTAAPAAAAARNAPARNAPARPAETGAPVARGRISLDLFIFSSGTVIVNAAAGSTDPAVSKLAKNIARAPVGFATTESGDRASKIDWPPAGLKSGGDDEAAALEFVLASVASALQQANAERLILLGEKISALLLTADGKPHKHLGSIRVATGPSLQTMLSDPTSKAVLWRSMQKLAV